MHLGPPVMKMAGGNQAIATVVSRPDQDQDVAASDAAQKLSQLLGHGKPGILHKHLCRQACIGAAPIYLPHLLCGHKLHYLPPTTEAMAYSLE